MDALVGHTGFVGGHLARQGQFGAQFNSKTIGDSAGGVFDTVVCAAAPGSMFEANRYPEEDRKKMEVLQGHLAHLRAKRFVLISSIAVLESFDGRYDEASAVYQKEVPYGLHRRQLEEFVLETFPIATVIRLPALFGDGLKKNFLFDILNPSPTMLSVDSFEQTIASLPPDLRDVPGEVYEFDSGRALHVINRVRLATHPLSAAYCEAVSGVGVSAMQFYNPASTFQFFNIDNVWADCQRALEHGHTIVHVAPEPQSTARIYQAVTGQEMPQTRAKIHREDMRTSLADLWDGKVPYSHKAAAVLQDIKTFMARQRPVA